MARIHTRFAELPNIRVKGLMGMASFTDDMQKVRNEFRYLKSLFNKHSTPQTRNTLHGHEQRLFCRHRRRKHHGKDWEPDFWGEGRSLREWSKYPFNVQLLNSQFSMIDFYGSSGIRSYSPRTLRQKNRGPSLTRRATTERRNNKK